MIHSILPAVVAAILTAVATAPARAQSQRTEQLHIGRSVVSFDATKLKVKTQEGETLDVTLATDWKSNGDGTPVVTSAPATKDDLISGAVVFIAAEKAANGKIEHQIIVGKNGVVPLL